MKVFLTFPDRDFDPAATAVAIGDDAFRDLEIETLIATMAKGDPLVREAVEAGFRTAFANDRRTILHRQAVLADCLANPGVVHNLYATMGEIARLERKVRFWYSRDRPSFLLHNSIEVMELFVGKLADLRRLAERVSGDFRSEGFGRLFGEMKQDLGDGWLREVEAHLDRLRFRRGVPVAGSLGLGNKFADRVLSRLPPDDRPWWRRLFGPRRFGGRKLIIDPRDESGWRCYSRFRDRVEAIAAVTLARSADHVSAYFRSLQVELAFFVGCLALHDALAGLGVATTFPSSETSDLRLGWSGLRDVALALRVKRAPVGNDGSADGRPMLLVTGANRGGKTTFLRSLGQAVLMMQAGLFVAADAFRATPVAMLHTHFLREEDGGLRSGRLDAELARMSDIVDRLGQNALLLLNESFSSTNEREGSEIARQVTTALRDSGVRLAYVSHLHEFAREESELDRGDVLFLKAERRDDGTRTFRIIEGKPEDTGWSLDLYRRIFGGDSAEKAGEIERV